jgi:hypothetical protein
MDGVKAFVTAFQSAHNWYLGTVADVTGAQANSVPPGLAHPIGALMAHIVQAEDGIINGMLQGKAPLWDSQGWGLKLGLPNVGVQEGKTARSMKVDPQSLAAYTKTVQAQTISYISSLNPSDLDREDQFFKHVPGTQSVALVLSTLLANTLAHTGEISALKGTQGAKGYPF